MLENKVEEDFVRSGEEINQSHALGFVSNKKMKANSAEPNVITKPIQTKNELLRQRVVDGIANGLKLTLSFLENRIGIANAIHRIKDSKNSAPA